MCIYIYIHLYISPSLSLYTYTHTHTYTYAQVYWLLSEMAGLDFAGSSQDQPLHRIANTIHKGG